VRILVADDSPTPRLLLKRELERLGHECLLAEDGLQALDVFRSAGAEVVISDWMMPGMDGPELCRRLRADASAPYAYFIMLTSLEDHEHTVEGMQAGADDYLTKPFRTDELEARLIAAARVTALYRRLATQQAELERLNAALFADSRRDHLTGLGNRLRLEEDLRALVARSHRYGHTFSVALYDVDRFKTFNDTFGHHAGDAVLHSIARALMQACRLSDTSYRYGGEELLIVFAEQGLEQAATAAERMRVDIEALAIPHPPGVVTVSAGIAAIEPSDGDDASRLLERADAALYEAKRLGRNRVIVAHRSGSPV
jgi:two-component system, cell cycle response regulator